MFALLNALAGALQPFHHLDPPGWFAWRRLAGPHLALAIAALGLFCLIVGSREGVFRFVAAPLAALAGVAATPAMLAVTHGTGIADRAVQIALPLALAVLAGAVPQTISFLALGALGALIGSSVVSAHEVLIGAIPGFVVAGVLGVVFAGVLDPIAAAAFGAQLLLGGLWRAFAHGPVARLLAGSGMMPAIALLGLTAVGAAIQFALWSDPQARRDARAGRREEKRRARQDRARDARFADYAKRGGG